MYRAVHAMKAIGQTAGCAVGGMPFTVALARVLRLIPQALSIEEVSLAECVGRVLAEPLAARIDLPSFDHSAMDGYAMCHADIAPGAWVPVTGQTAAGGAPGALTPGTACRVLTGAPLPYGADTVVAQENVDCRDGLLRIAVTPPRVPTCVGGAMTLASIGCSSPREQLWTGGMSL